MSVGGARPGAADNIPDNGKPERREPSARESRRMADATERVRGRKAPPRIRSDQSDGVLSMEVEHTDEKRFTAHLCDTFGTASYPLTQTFMVQLVNAVRPNSDEPLNSADVNAALAIVHGARRD